MAEKADSPKPEREKKEKPAEPKKTESPAAAEKTETEGGSRSKKINKMTLAEIQAKIEDTKAKQGGLRSKYAHQLAHKKSLLQG